MSSPTHRSQRQLRGVSSKSLSSLNVARSWAEKLLANHDICYTTTSTALGVVVWYVNQISPGISVIATTFVSTSKVTSIY